MGFTMTLNRSPSLQFALASALLAGCAVTAPGPSYQAPPGESVAVVRPIWASNLAGTKANVRIREINGKGVTMLFPEDVKIPGGTTRMGLFAWSGPGSSSITLCVVFEAISGERYKVAVAGLQRDWAVSLTRQTGTGDEPVAPQIVRHRPFDSNVLPCEGVHHG